MAFVICHIGINPQVQFFLFRGEFVYFGLTQAVDIYSQHLKELGICFLLWFFFGFGHGINNSSEQVEGVVVFCWFGGFVLFCVFTWMLCKL